MVEMVTRHESNCGPQLSGIKALPDVNITTRCNAVEEDHSVYFHLDVQCFRLSNRAEMRYMIYRSDDTVSQLGHTDQSYETMGMATTKNMENKHHG